MYHVISEQTPRGPIYLVEDTTTHTRKRGSFDCERSAQAFADYLNEMEGHDGRIIDEALPSASQWIPCSERMPDGAFGCLVTVWDTNPVTMDEFENVLPYFVGWDGEQWNDADGEQCPFEVIAWMPLPEPYKGEADG